MNRTPLVLAISFPLLGWIRDFHPLETCAARRTRKDGPPPGGTVLLLLFSAIFSLLILLKKRFFPLYHLINTVNILCNILHIFYTDQICFFATARLDLLRQNKLCRRSGTAGNNCLAFFQSSPMLRH